MKKNATVLLLGLALAATASANDPAVKGDVKKDGASVAPRVQTRTSTAKVDKDSAKGKVDPSNGKEGAKDPYAVPLLREAKPLI